MKNRAQGALEILLLIGGAIIIASVVVALIIGVSSTGTESSGPAKSGTISIAKKQQMALYGYSLPGGVSNSNLVVYYPFSGNTNDASKNGHNGTIAGGAGGVTLTTDNHGNANSAYLFNTPSGTGHINIPNSTMFDVQQFTISAWILANSLPQSGHIFEKGPVNSQYSFFFEGANLKFRTYNSSVVIDDFDIPQSNLGITAGNWYMISEVYDGVYKRVYVNGVEYVNASNPTAPWAYSVTMRTGQNGQKIGAYGGGSGYFFKGKIDEVIIFSRALSANEIKKMYDDSR